MAVVTMSVKYVVLFGVNWFWKVRDMTHTYARANADFLVYITNLLYTSTVHR